MNFWGMKSRSLACLCSLFLLQFKVVASILISSFPIFIFLKLWQPFCFSAENYTTLLPLYSHFCVTIKQFLKNLLKTGSINTEMLFYWHLGMVAINLKQVSINKKQCFSLFETIIFLMIYSLKFWSIFNNLK